MTHYEKFARGLYWLNKAVASVEAWFMIVSMVALVIIMTMQIACRYVFYLPTPWAEEAACYIFIWLGFVGSGYALFRHEHIDINVADSIILAHASDPEKVFRFYRKLVLVICILFFMYFLNLYSSFVARIAARNQYSAAMQISMVIPMSGGIVGFVLMLFHGVSLLLIPESLRKEE